MLKIFRKQKFVKKIFYLLAIIIVPSFIFWGSSSVIRERQTKGSAGKIFGKKISYDEYLGALNAWRNQLKIKFGDKAHQIENILDANGAVWDRLILRYGIKKAKIRVSNDELTKHITSLPFLQKDGAFDPELYQLFLRYSLNTPVRIFEENIRETLKFQKLYEQLTSDAFVTEKEVKDKYIQEYEQIKVKYISALSKEQEGEIAINETELIDSYNEQKEEFIIPIQINLKYIGKDFPENASDEQKQDINEESLEVSQYLIEGNDLIAAQNKFNLDIKETGFLSLGEPVLGQEWSPTDLMILFNLKQGQFTDVILTERGPYIFQLKEKRLDYQQAFEEVKNEIKDKLTNQKSRKLAKTKMDEFYSRIKTKKQENLDLGLTTIAGQLSLTLKETNFFTWNSEVSEIGLFREFNSAAFILTDAETSEVIELPQGYFIIIAVSGRNPIDEEDFQNKKEELKVVILEEKKNSKFETFFANLRAKARLVDYISLQQAQQKPLVEID